MIKLDSKLPKLYNGMTMEFKRELLANPKNVQVAIIYFDCPTITTDTFAGFDADDPTIRIRKIEPLFGSIKERVEGIYEEVYAERVGAETIPFDAERDAKDNGTSSRLALGSSDIVDAEIVENTSESSGVDEVAFSSGVKGAIGEALDDAVAEINKKSTKKKLTVVKGK